MEACVARSAWFSLVHRRARFLLLSCWSSHLPAVTCHGLVQGRGRMMCGRSWGIQRSESMRRRRRGRLSSAPALVRRRRESNASKADEVSLALHVQMSLRPNAFDRGFTSCSQAMRRKTTLRPGEGWISAWWRDCRCVPVTEQCEHNQCGCAVIQLSGNEPPAC